jgi:hypothetical protein
LLKKMADDADPQASDVLAEQRPVLGHRLIGACGITRIMPGDHLEHQCVVAHCAGHRPDVVEGKVPSRVLREAWGVQKKRRNNPLHYEIT